MFSVDFNDIVTLTVPPHKRTLKRIALLHTFISPLLAIYYEFVAYRVSVLYQISYDGSTIHLQKFLNDKFKNGLEGIVIITNQTVSPYYIADKLYGSDPIYVHDKAFTGDPMYLGDKAWYDNQFDFTVQIPAILYATLNLNQVTAFIKDYKLAGKTFNIQSV